MKNNHSELASTVSDSKIIRIGIIDVEVIGFRLFGILTHFFRCDSIIHFESVKCDQWKEDWVESSIVKSRESTILGYVYHWNEENGVVWERIHTTHKLAITRESELISSK